jgi:multiple sugar transport system substrate-binding protein
LKKNIIILLALLLVFTAFVGCSSSNSNSNGGKTNVNSGNPNEGDAESINLRYMIWDQNQVPAYQQIVDNFTAKNPNINVEIQVIPWGNYWDKLKTEIAGGTAPDIFWNFIPYVPSFSNKGALLDISEYVERDNVDLSKFNSTLVSGFEVDDKRYAIPKDWDATGFFYNKDLLKEAGYESYPEDLTWNAEDGGTFIDFMQKLTFDTNGKHPNEQGFDPNNVAQYGFLLMDRGVIDPGHLVGYAKGNGTGVINDNQLELNDELVDTFTFLHDFINKYHVHPTYTDVHTSGSESQFFSERVAVWMNGSWSMKPINESASFEWGIAPLPAGSVGSYTRINGLGDSIFSKTAHPEEAWKFVSYIASPEAQDILGSTGTAFPGHEDSVAKFVEHYEELGIDASIWIDMLNGNTTTQPVATNYDAWESIFVKYSSLSLAGEMSPREALEKIKEEGDPVAGGK